MGRRGRSQPAAYAVLRVDHDPLRREHELEDESEEVEGVLTVKADAEEGRTPWTPRRSAARIRIPRPRGEQETIEEERHPNREDGEEQPREAQRGDPDEHADECCEGDAH